MAEITTVLADGFPIVLRGLSSILGAEPDITVLAETWDGLLATELVERYHPSVLLVDIKLSGLNGIDVTRNVHQRFPETKVVVMTPNSTEPILMDALKNGAAGVVLKSAGTAEFVLAVREVAAGHRYLSPALTDRAIEAYIGNAVLAVEPTPYDALTTREREVLQLAAEGGSSADIAGRLGISIRTAETHRSHVMRKLGLRTQTELLRFAFRRGILPMEV